MITAPFNFVPLNEDIFFPQWADDISHDIPFEDGESGVIDITITAKSPLFIRDSCNEQQFCNHNGTYYIPGSSVKGMVRSVMEILSFSKLNENLFMDSTYAVRDLSNAKNFYMSQMNQLNNTTYCGWLVKTDDGYVIEECGVPGRISHKQIDKALGIDFASHFKKVGFEKTSQYKYDLAGGVYKQIKVGELRKSTTNSKYDRRLFCDYDANGTEGTLVLTGQPTPRKDSGKMGDGKGFEFVFFEPKNPLKVSKQQLDNFKFAYFDGRDTEPQESPDWKFWKEKLLQGEKVPVFFQKQGGQLTHFGLSYLYKLPYKHSIADGIYTSHLGNEQLDLTQGLFGYVDKHTQRALKGRVQFSHFQAVENVQILPPREEILGTPRASYYPIYVRQQSKEFVTYMDADFHIAGRKRYPVHSGSHTTKTEKTGNENVSTTFTPLKEGVVFKGKLRYHNLKKAELGGILSALTFHKTPQTYHSIGMAKPLGYGKISVKVDGVTDLEACLRAFELHVSGQISDWSTRPQITELLTMATEQNNSGNSKLKYMSLSEFASNKTTGGDYLKCYSELDGITSVQPQTLISADDIKILEEENRAFIERQKAYEAKRKLQKEHDTLYAITKTSDNIDQIKAYLSKYPDSEHTGTLYERIEMLETVAQQKSRDAESSKANAQWEKVVAVDQKHKITALQGFLDQFPNASQVPEAKAQLEALTTPQQTNAFDLSKFSKFKPLAKNIRKLAGNKPLSEAQKEALEAHLLSIKDKTKNYKPSDYSSDDLLGGERAQAIKEQLV